jgi:hypothetical protein
VFIAKELKPRRFLKVKFFKVNIVSKCNISAFTLALFLVVKWLVT